MNPYINQCVMAIPGIEFFFQLPAINFQRLDHMDLNEALDLDNRAILYAQHHLHTCADPHKYVFNDNWRNLRVRIDFLNELNSRYTKIDPNQGIVQAIVDKKVLDNIQTLLNDPVMKKLVKRKQMADEYKANLYYTITYTDEPIGMMLDDFLHKTPEIEAIFQARPDYKKRVTLYDEEEKFHDFVENYNAKKNITKQNTS